MRLVVVTIYDVFVIEFIGTTTGRALAIFRSDFSLRMYSEMKKILPTLKYIEYLDEDVCIVYIAIIYRAWKCFVFCRIQSSRVSFDMYG